MTTVFGGPQTIPQTQQTTQNINQATTQQQQMQTAQAQAQQQTIQPSQQAGQVGEWARQYAQDIWSGANPVGQLQIAPFTAEQQAAIPQLFASGMGQQGLIGQGQGYLGQGTGLMGTAGQAITPQDINSFYNPMAGNVTAQLQNIFGQQNLANRLGATAASGGIGGDRAAVAQGILANQQTLGAGQIYSQLYQNALQAAQQQKAQQLQAGQSLAGTAFPTMQAGFGGLGTALQAGTLEQQQTQQVYNAAYQNQMNQYQDFFNRMGALQGLVPALNQAFGVTTTGTGMQGGQTLGQALGTLSGSQLGTGLGQVTYPAPAVLPQVAGLGSLALGAAGLFGLSDRKEKTDIKKLGVHKFTGLPLYAYRYKGDPKTYPKVVGPMAQDVAKIHPGLVARLPKRQSGGSVLALPTAADWQAKIPPMLSQGMAFQPLFSASMAAPGGSGTGVSVNVGGGGGTTVGGLASGNPYSWAPGQPVSQGLAAQLAAQPASFWAGADPQNMGLGRSNFGGPGGSYGLKRGGRIQGYQDAGPVVSDEESNDSEPDSDTDDDTASTKTDFTKYAKGMNLLNQYAKSATPKTPQVQPLKMPDTPWRLGQMPAAAAMSMQRGGDADGNGAKTVPSADPDLAALRFEQTANLVQGHEVPPFQKGFAKGGPVKGYADAGPVDDSEDDGEHEPAGPLDLSMAEPDDTADTVPTPLPRPRPQEAGFGQGRGMLPPPGGGRMLPRAGGGLPGGMMQSPYMALMQAGLGMLAASGQRDARGLPMSPLGAIGAGGMAGMNTLQQQQAFALKQRALDESMALRREQLNALEQHRRALEGTAAERLAIARGETGKPITLQTPYGPKSVIRQPDGTLVDAYSGRAVGQQTAISSTATPTAGAFDSGPIAPPETDDQKAVVAGLAGKQQNNEPIFKTPQRSSPEFQDMLESMQTSPQQFDFLAARLALGDTSVLTGTRGRAGAAIFANALKARAQDYWMDRGLGPKEANMAMVELGAKKAGARAIENQTGRITGALGRAAETAKVVTALSDKIDRTQYPTINSVILAAKRHTGDEDTVRYGLAMETFIKNYAAATGQGSAVFTDHQYKTMTDRLNEAWSKGQVRAMVDQGIVEINRELKGTHNALDMYLGKGTEPEGLGETAPAGGKPTPTDADRAYVKAHPEKRQQFIKHFGIEP